MKRQTEVIIALDFDDEKTVFAFLEQLPQIDNYPPYVKVGMELYYQYGSDIIRKLQAKGYRIFLDLKLHDIPNTVIKAMKVLKELHVDIINLHAKVGKSCLREVATLFKDTETKVIAVTELTSTSEEMLRDEFLCTKQMDDAVLHYAQMVYESQLDGVVCSPHEVPLIKRACGEQFLCVTPGIRYAVNDDQVRVTTPKQAQQLGSDFIVVGRTITNAENPAHIYEQIVTELKEENNEL